MFINMPSSFPHDKFHEFGKHAAEFLPGLLSDQHLSDPLNRADHFYRAWMAVCYRYRTCTECNEEFKALHINAPDLWRECNSDEEHAYKLGRCLYTFFTNGLSVFESLGFCLYFVGGAIRPGDFPYMGKPKQITLKATSGAFTAAFPQTSITRGLVELPQKAEFNRIEEIRNILAHRLIGRRSVRSYGILNSDGTSTHTREDVLNLLGSDAEPSFDEELIQRHLDAITSLLTSLVEASLEFAKSNKPVQRVK